MAANHNGNNDIPEEMDHCDLDLEYEEDLACGCSNEADSEFDTIIGHIEEIVIDDEFQQLQRDFMEKYYMEFDDSEENKFSYTDIHKNYVELIEKFLADELSGRIPGFSMEEFLRQVGERREELDGEIFEMLLTFSDFLSFKEMFLDYKAEKEGLTVDLSPGICVTHMPDDYQGAGSLSLQGFNYQKFP